MRLNRCYTSLYLYRPESLALKDYAEKHDVSVSRAIARMIRNECKAELEKRKAEHAA
jgi:hypothetical protein